MTKLPEDISDERIVNATLEQRQKYEISGEGIGLHWDELNEDISVPGLLLGNIDITRKKI